MKLIRHGELNKEKPGICVDGINYDVSGFIGDYNEEFFANGGLPHLEWMMQKYKGTLSKVSDGTRLALQLQGLQKLYPRDKIMQITK